MESAVQELLNDENRFNELTKKIFETADKENSGSVDVPEIKILLRIICIELGIAPPSDEQIDDAASRLDSDRPEKLDYESFKSFVSEVLNALLQAIQY